MQKIKTKIMTEYVGVEIEVETEVEVEDIGDKFDV